MGDRDMMSLCRYFYFTTVMASLLSSPTSSGTVQLRQHNINDILSTTEFVFVNFYADWCRFSQILKPIFEQSSDRVYKDYPDESKVKYGMVDCDRETGIASQYHVSKYPTLKMFRNGQLIKKEYRGQRSVDALSSFVLDQLKSPVQEVSNLDDLESINRKKRNIIGYFESAESESYKTYSKVASVLRDDCTFYAALGSVSETERRIGEKIIYRPPLDEETLEESEHDMLYSGSLQHYGMLEQWSTDKCVPLVREITFENAEELTEEGLPFLILFHNPEDTHIVERFHKQVALELLSEKSSFNFLTADGLKFSHPLHHLGKSSKDLPVLAIDSFRHMYIFPHNVNENLETPGMLKQFLADLHSGKLHREFHHGPDPTPAPTPAAPKQVEASEEAGEAQPKTVEKHIPKEVEPEQDTATKTEKQKDPTSPPESIFKKLAPSRSRYTVLKDEL